MATFEELTGLSPVEEPTAPRPLETLHGTGADTRKQQAVQQESLRQETGVGDLFGAAWERNITNNFVDTIQRKLDHEPEEGFEVDLWLEENRESIPGVNMEAFQGVRSTAEAEELRADQIRALENDAVVASKGYGGMAATVLAGMVDPAELAVGIATGGAGKAGTIASRFTRGARQGLQGGVAAAALGTTVDPLADAQQIVYGGLTGALIGGPAGVVFNRSARRARDSYGAEVRDLPSADKDYVDTSPFNAADMTENPQSLGAGALNDDMDMDAMSPQHSEIFEQSRQFVRDNGLATRMDDTDLNVDTPTGRAAKRFSDALANQEFMVDALNDFDRMQQGGTIEKTLGYNLLESPDGRLRNNRSGAMLRENYEHRLQSHALPILEDSYAAWSKGRKIGRIQRENPRARAEFDREVVAELEARFHEGKPVSNEPSIVAAADAIDANYADALVVAKGRDGEVSVSGFEDIQAKSGFFNHRWSGDGIRKALKKGYKQAELENLLKKGYRSAYPDMDDAHMSMIAKAVVRRAKARADGIDTNMLNTLDADGQTYLREMLTDSGYTDAHVDNLIDSIRGRKEDQSKLGTTKARVQVDLRTTENGLSLMDLVDTNLSRVLSKYNRDIAGNAALARKGIPNRQVRKEVIEAALSERRARGMEAGTDQRQFLEDIFTYFDSGPIGGGPTPLVSRTKRLTNLALLNQMGLTQTAETGAQMAAVGISTWRKHAAATYKDLKAGSPLLDELRPLMGRIGEDHMLFRDDLMLDELRDVADANRYIKGLDLALGKGQRLQGYLSGFYHVRAAQQKIAVASQADKVMQRVRDGADFEQLRGIGINPDQMKKNLQYVEFDSEGFVDKLNLDQWDDIDAEDFILALHRHSAQVVQKALAGEEQMWMHKTMGSLLSHLKSFPLLAMRKQAVRAAGTDNSLFVATTTMGLATAAIMFDAKQVINGRSDRVTPMETLKGAAAMSNVTGWVPMFTDPAAAMLGLKSAQFSQYGRYDISNSIVGTPPVLPTVNRILQLPAAALPNELSANERIRIAQATPIVGNLYGFAYIFNKMKQ